MPVHWKQSEIVKEWAQLVESGPFSSLTILGCLVYDFSYGRNVIPPVVLSRL